MTFGGLFFCFFLLKVTENAGQDVFLERPESQRVDLNTSVHLNCTANESMASVQWWRRDSAVTATTGRVTVDQQGTLQIASATWSDIGEYTCIIRFENNTFSASATLDITGYVKLHVDAEEGVSTINHVVGEDQTVDCPVSGYPGPQSLYWKYKDTGVNVTSDGSVESGVFVDGQGKLDLSKVDSAQRTLFECVGVDAAGCSARTLIRVNSVEPEEAKEEEDLNLLEWYFIAAYCVGGALVVAGLVVVLSVCWLARDQCCDRIAKKKPTRVRVRRSKVNLGDDVEVEAYG